MWEDYKMEPYFYSHKEDFERVARVRYTFQNGYWFLEIRNKYSFFYIFRGDKWFKTLDDVCTFHRTNFKNKQLVLC